ncbi:MAG: HAD family hydrolase [Candidatus Binataceae bacterium]
MALVDNGAIKAVVFDLFDTLVKWEPERLPLLHWRQRSTHSTLPWILPSLQERMGPRFELETFLTVYHEVIDEINAEREREGIEITCQERFERTLERLGYSDPAERSLLAFHVTRLHMDGVRKVTFAPPERSDAVRRLAPHLRLGLLSNFDDAQCGREVLLDTGVADLFDAVIISAEAGLRKPNPLIYQRILTMLHVEPRAILFVGDTPREDVLGPRLAAMRVAWVNKRGAPLPEGIPEPDLMVADIAELPALLGV